MPELIVPERNVLPQEYFMKSLHTLLSRWPGIAAAVLLAALTAGCARPLSIQHEFFSPLNGTVAKSGALTRHTVSHHRALQAAQRACGTHVSDLSGQAGTDGPDFGHSAARESLADVCATTARPPAAAYGGTSNAYRRWVDDQVRELPELGETAAPAAGGS